MNTEVLKLAIQYAIEHRDCNGHSTCELGILADTILIKPLHFEDPDWEFVAKISPAQMDLGMTPPAWNRLAKKLSMVLGDIPE